VFTDKQKIAMCDSRKCKEGKGTTRMIAKTEVLFTEEKCPDCGHALFWVEGRKKHRVHKQVRIKDRNSVW
jgi:hypothetical protein